MRKGPGFYQQDKPKQKPRSDYKKDEDNALHKSDNKNLRLKYKPNKDLDHLLNSLEKDTEIKGNETKIISAKFAPDADKNIGKKEKRPYQKGKNNLDFTKSKKTKT